MTAYRYRALNDTGKLVKGVLEGDSERQIRSQLRGRNLRPVEVAVANRQATEKAGTGFSLFRPRISAGELALLTRQMATLVQSNLPLDECLQATAEQTRKPRLKGHVAAGALAGVRGLHPGLCHGRVSAGVQRDVSGDGQRR